MLVVKRDGKTESVKFDKITARIQKLCYGLDPTVEPVKVAMKVIEGIYDGVTTSELDNLAAEVAASLTTTHPEYALLASRIAVSNLHKNTQKSFSKTMELLYTYVDPKTGKKAPLLADDVYDIIQKNSEVLDSTIIYDRDFDEYVTAPLHGFDSADHYYTASSSRQYLGGITVPTLLLHASDDPFMTESAIPRPDELSESVTLELSPHGGHVGFVTGVWPWRPRYWLDERIPAYLARYL